MLHRPQAADLILTLSAVVGFLAAIAAFTWMRGGVSGSGGALLVCVSTGLLVVAGLVLLGLPGLAWRLEPWVTILLILGAAGTALAGYLLEWPPIWVPALVALFAAILRPLHLGEPT